MGIFYEFDEDEADREYEAWFERRVNKEHIDKYGPDGMDNRMMPQKGLTIEMIEETRRELLAFKN